MSTSDEQRTDETTNVRVTREETRTSIAGTDGESRRKRILIVAAVAVLPMVLVVFAFLLVRPAKEVKTKVPAAGNTGTVKFLMEQQWLIRMKLAQVEEQTVARQITSTGRVVPAANSQALVAPPVSGIIAGKGLPRMGQH
ncbi:MAG: hypothetical protein H0W34_13165, partial [Pyrinomonadaceae bacterium]|nr:hypothetical protein [Pyrinomonadaceae bacterium]